MSELMDKILLDAVGDLDNDELDQIQFRDIEFSSKSAKILIRNPSKGKKIRWTFITEEATIILKDHAKKWHGWHEKSLNLDLTRTGLNVF